MIEFRTHLMAAIGMACVVSGWMPTAAQAQFAKPPSLSDLFDRYAPYQGYDEEASIRYRIDQRVSLSEIPSDAKRVRCWISVPSDQRDQRLLQMDVLKAPVGWRMVQDAERRGTFLYFEVEEPQSDLLVVDLALELIRDPVFQNVNESASGPLTEAMRTLYAEHLVLDAPHMSVTPKVQAMADAICGDETNIAAQALAILDDVIARSDHYSNTKDPDMPRCGIGDAGNCLLQGGGCCTDLNSLFIALARARGIPCRLNMGYRLQSIHEGTMHDSGYRCWIEYFAPGYGWLSADVVEAETPGGLGPARWFTGLTAQRVWLNQGREFRLADDLATPTINHMSVGYAEIDGRPVRLLPEDDVPPQLTRQLRFERLD